MQIVCIMSDRKSHLFTRVNWDELLLNVGAVGINTTGKRNGKIVEILRTL